MITNKKMLLNNILIMFLVSSLTTCLMYIFINGQGSKSISQNQSVNISTVDDDVGKVDLNKASHEELKSLPNIGDKLADEIINNRPYRSVYDLHKIRGIGDNIISNIKERVMVNANE